MTSREYALQNLREITERLGPGQSLHVDNSQTLALFGFTAGGPNPDARRKANIEAIRRATEFAKEQGGYCIFDAELPPTLEFGRWHFSPPRGSVVPVFDDA
jgi:hypothetical protein